MHRIEKEKNIRPILFILSIHVKRVFFFVPFAASWFKQEWDLLMRQAMEHMAEDMNQCA